MTYTITHLGPSSGFAMTDEKGTAVAFDKCAIALRKLVLPDENAGDVVVVHDYNLVLDDCPEHTLRRVRQTYCGECRNPTDAHKLSCTVPERDKT